MLTTGPGKGLHNYPIELLFVAPAPGAAVQEDPKLKAAWDTMKKSWTQVKKDRRELCMRL
jgi:hypothetical protein